MGGWGVLQLVYTFPYCYVSVIFVGLYFLAASVFNNYRRSVFGQLKWLGIYTVFIHRFKKKSMVICMFDFLGWVD